jgi:hypothetical protein
MYELLNQDKLSACLLGLSAIQISIRINADFLRRTRMAILSDRWKEISPSQFPWERDALDFIRQGLPDCDPYRVWSNFELLPRMEALMR